MTVRQQVCKYQFVLCKVSTFLLVGWVRTALFLLAPPTGGAPIEGGVTEAWRERCWEVISEVFHNNCEHHDSEPERNGSSFLQHTKDIGSIHLSS